jgi:hypothetical protein
MARSNLKMHTERVTLARQRNVVPFDNHRGRLHVARSSAAKTCPSSVVVRLPLPAESRASERTTDAQTSRSEGNEGRLTAFDAVVALLLSLSTLTGPALVWTLLNF